MADDEQRPDERPRPKYGELAPEGWVWHPPADANRLDTTHPTAEPDRYGEHGDAGQRTAAGQDQRAPHADRPWFGPQNPQNPQNQQHSQGQHPQNLYPHPQHRQNGQSPQLRSDAPRWNMTVTVVLIVFGFFGATNSIGGLLSLPTAMQLMHTNENLGDYTPAGSVQGTLIAGAITVGLIWAISTGLSVWLLVKRRMAFYIPLIAGVVALIALLGFMSAVLLTDPVLIDFYSGVTPTPSGTPTP
ncbi:DUF6264 family protein [Leifsonia sp. Le1]|uniref:DUF6264 family protein n=1 Tax=Leifsonia sp. Le1 TaxID=3404918 RepID=UPI003EB846F1